MPRPLKSCGQCGSFQGKFLLIQIDTTDESIQIMKRSKLGKRDLEALRQNVPCAFTGIVLALALGFTANAQAPAQDDNPSTCGPQALKKALEQDGKLQAADLFAMHETGLAPLCLGDYALSR